ncbi:GGDEF domain-containing protein [Sutcliffiella halmapala]|uniref:GGDEF domain-containing protein n=1 Tax=Sutcliffiella halmapala TaxID=79882 RepID=UPI001474CF7B|nr:GGDEF domain-containing protein [Sutcliffiella halmapala]
MKIKYAFAMPQASLEKQGLLEKHLFNVNIQRCKLFASIVILFEVILIMMNLSSMYTSMNTIFVFNIYLLLYFILLIMSIFMLFYMRSFEKRLTYTEEQYKRFRFGLLSFVNFFLVWGAVVTLVDQKDYGHVMAFVVNFMCVSILFHTSNRTILMLYILPISVLVIGLPIFQSSSAILMGHYINLSVFLFFCWLASRMLYISVSSNFYNKMLLTESNDSLALKIAENEKINLELAKVNEQLKKMTIIDELTNIPNRRGFHQYIASVLSNSTEKRKLTLMMLDIDCFKLFNDNYGHLEGDKVIRKVAQRMRYNIASSASIAARFGGEEFIVAVFDLEKAEVVRLAEDLRRSIIDLKISHEFSLVENHVTVSIGIASGNVENENDMEQLMEDADRALYKSKSSGRNRVEVFEESFVIS